MTQADIKYGLAGVVTDDTAVSKVMPETNSLTYRGYAVQDLATQCRFEETAYLIWNGELPNASQLAEFNAKEVSLRGLSDDIIDVMRKFPKGAHPMATLRTAVSFLGLEDNEIEDHATDKLYDRALSLYAKIPQIVATDYRLRNGLEPIAPKAELPFSENFFHMCFGKVPAEETV